MTAREVPGPGPRPSLGLRVQRRPAPCACPEQGAHQCRGALTPLLPGHRRESSIVFTDNDHVCPHLMITFFHIMTTCTAPITATTPRAAPDQSRDRKGAGARDNQSRDRKGAGSPTNHAAACHEARRVPYLPAPTALRPGITSLRQRRYALHGPTSLRQRRYALQPRVAAQRLPWDNGPIEQVNPEGVASLTIERAVTPLGLVAFG
jgi:hypothetical protein